MTLSCIYFGILVLLIQNNQLEDQHKLYMYEWTIKNITTEESGCQKCQLYVTGNLGKELQCVNNNAHSLITIFR